MLRRGEPQDSSDNDDLLLEDSDEEGLSGELGLDASSDEGMPEGCMLSSAVQASGWQTDRQVVAALAIRLQLCMAESSIGRR